MSTQRENWVVDYCCGVNCSFGHRARNIRQSIDQQRTAVVWDNLYLDTPINSTLSPSGRRSLGTVTDLIYEPSHIRLLALDVQLPDTRLYYWWNWSPHGHTRSLTNELVPVVEALTVCVVTYCVDTERSSVVAVVSARSSTSNVTGVAGEAQTRLNVISHTTLR